MIIDYCQPMAFLIIRSISFSIISCGFETQLLGAERQKSADVAGGEWSTPRSLDRT